MGKGSRERQRGVRQKNNTSSDNRSGHIMSAKSDTVIKNRYVIEKEIDDGFYGEYLGFDIYSERKVAIKEYLPVVSDVVYCSPVHTLRICEIPDENNTLFVAGRPKYIEEGKALSKIQDENAIVKIYDSFKHNGTGYLVKEYLDGESLKDFIGRNGKMSPERAVEAMMPIINIMGKIHKKGILHTEICPQNIFVMGDGSLKLDVARRPAIMLDIRINIAAVVDGYSPFEQYSSKSIIGKYTDVYSIGAVLYKLITGETPPDAFERMNNYKKSGKEYAYTYP